MPNVNVENDTLSNRIIKCISSSLRKGDFEELQNDGCNKWNDLYVEMFLQIYSKLIDESTFTYICSDVFLNEPLVLFKYNKNTVNYIHVVSVPFIKHFFLTKNKKKRIIPEESKLEEFKPPKFFLCDAETFEDDDCDLLFGSSNRIVLSNELIKKLIKMYVLADHAAWHYLSDNKNDYLHAGTREIENKVFLHNIITVNASEKLQTFIHNPTKTEAKIKSLFIMKSTDSENSSSSDESESDTQ